MDFLIADETALGHSFLDISVPLSESNIENTLVLSYNAPDSRFYGFVNGSFKNSESPAMTLMYGWLQNEDGSTVLASEPEKFISKKNSAIGGEWVCVEVGWEGKAEISRSSLGQFQLYKLESQRGIGISSSIFLLLGQHELLPNDNYLIETANYGVAYSQNTILKDVLSVPPGVNVLLKQGKALYQDSKNFLFREELRDKFHKNNKGYWDDLFDLMRESVLVFSGLESLEIGLSGGKDSRLLLALVNSTSMKKNLSVFTNGPESSPEVRSARLIAESLNLQFKVNYPKLSFRRTPPNFPELIDMITFHLLATDGEMSPKDLVRPSKSSSRVVVDGQESGLRNINKIRHESLEDFRNWLFIHLGRNDFSGILGESGQTSANEAFRSNIAYLEKLGIEPSQMSTFHRVAFRGSRWVSRVWKNQNEQRFSPHLLRSDIVPQHTFNSGWGSRDKEDFHYEMISRASPDIVNIPFSQQVWPAKKGRQKTQSFEWAEDESEADYNLVIQGMLLNYDQVETFISMELEDYVQAKVLKPNFMPSISTLKAGHHQKLLQVLQFAVLKNLVRTGNLKNEFNSFASLAR